MAATVDDHDRFFDPMTAAGRWRRAGANSKPKKAGR
jgi:hypothetical protein